jgi:hypothetical protein
MALISKEALQRSFQSLRERWKEYEREIEGNKGRVFLRKRWKGVKRKWGKRLNVMTKKTKIGLKIFFLIC